MNKLFSFFYLYVYAIEIDPSGIGYLQSGFSFEVAILKVEHIVSEWGGGVAMYDSE